MATTQGAPIASSSSTASAHASTLDNKDSDMTTQPKLLCLVEMDSTLFSVDYVPDAIIDTLKKAIYNEIATDSSFKAKDLTLWKAEIPTVRGAMYSRDYKRLVDDIKLDPNNKMEADDKLRDYIQMALSKTIQIIVQTPSSELKRRLDQDDLMRPLKQFKPNSTVHKEVRRLVYYADQTESNKPLIERIRLGEFVRVYGARASGKSSRIVDAMETLTAEGFTCIYVDLQNFNVNNLWSSLNQRLKVYGPVNFNDSGGFEETFSVNGNMWERPVVIFFDEFDILHRENWKEARDSILGAIRSLKNDPPKHVIRSIVSIGTYAILQLNQTGQELSPFNASDNFQNTSLSLDQVRELYLEFAKDREMVIEDNVIGDIFKKTNGHAGLVNICGVALEKYRLAQPSGRYVDMNDWGSVQNSLISSMRLYGTFQKLVTDLTEKNEKQKSALTLYRSRFLGNPSETEVSISDVSHHLARYLTALGVLRPGSEEDRFNTASPLMDSLIRQTIIPDAFPDAPKIKPPTRSDHSLDILNVIKSALPLFDKDLIERAHRVSHKTATSPIRVDRIPGRRVPRESVYDSEMTRILMNWLSSQNGYQVIGQYNIGGLFCDIMIRIGELPYPVAIELVVTETSQVIQEHIDKTVNYKNLTKANEGWVIHFTREDNYLKNPLWQNSEMLDKGIYMIHVWHNADFTEVRLSARWKDSCGDVINVDDERII
ncbi:hypothetical protein BGZ79_005647 [Entomortierella chlamydospora]|nr:hypothetical protein BGZ79_005647 [Entomortierella chlamydospora]